MPVWRRRWRCGEVDMELTERQRTILKTVVESYVQTAAPIPSEKIAGQPGLKFSSATVRNDLMELEELGLLTHPHTSAGRVPSDVGYRYYIEHLMTETRVTPVEAQTVWHQFHQVEAEIDEWVPLAAAIMAQMSRTAALVTRLRSREQRVRRVELVSVDDDLVLVVLIMQSGSIQQRMLRLEKPAERDDLIMTANVLSGMLAGKTGNQVLREATRLFGLEQELATVVARMIEQSQRSWGGDIIYEGIGFVSVEPEFGRVDRVVDLMEALQRGSRLEPIFADVLDSGELRVVIGSENQDEEMRRWSLILRRYGTSDQGAGVLGVVGPTRMKYWKTVSLVRFMGDLMDRLIEQSSQQRR
jgi:heat-inducible transcriptional repressor